VLKVSQQLPQFPYSSMIPNCGKSTEQDVLEKNRHFTGKGRDRNVMATYTVLKVETILRKHLLCTRYKVHTRLTRKFKVLKLFHIQI
jgi:hypothetical protein